jgi:hypothetical protein
VIAEGVHAIIVIDEPVSALLLDRLQHREQPRRRGRLHMKSHKPSPLIWLRRIRRPITPYVSRDRLLHLAIRHASRVLHPVFFRLGNQDASELLHVRELKGALFQLGLELRQISQRE